MNKPKTISYRPTTDREAEVRKFLENEKNRRNATSLSGTVEAIILDFKNGVTIYEPKKKK